MTTTDTRAAAYYDLRESLGERQREVLKTCTYPGCTKEIRARGYCTTHYARFMKHGDASWGRQIKHGKWKSRVYNIWRSMLKRCYNQNHKSYIRYGARGISVCNEWQESFIAFYRDMGDPPSPVHQIDRIDNEGHYELSNCRWSTPAENAKHKSHRGNKLTMEKANEIRRLKKEGVGTTVIARRFGIATNTVLVIMRGETWKEYDLSWLLRKVTA